MGDSLQKLIGGQIRVQRKSAGLTQKELGEQANFSHQAISDYENGKRSLDIIAAFSLADNLDCSVEDFRPEPEPSVCDTPTSLWEGETATPFDY